MGFVRQQEERLAIRYVRWQYQKLGKPVPDESELVQLARKIVDEAHRIGRERGQNVMSILKDLIAGLKR
jgi:hypothetical protein